MGRINGWKRQHHHSKLSDAKEELDERGKVRIGVWEHDEGGRIEHVYEPGTAKEFIVQTVGIDRQFDEEGRYEYRKDGGNANKELMRKYP
jgi:hypothetical protein